MFGIQRNRGKNVPALLRVAEHRMNNFKFIRRELRTEERDSSVFIAVSTRKHDMYGAVIGEAALEQIREILVKDLERQIRKERHKIERIKSKGY